jgi:peptide-methionine (S)-S-oxide reductase
MEMGHYVNLCRLSRESKHQRKQGVLMGQEQLKKIDSKRLEVATLGGGCFWCTEAIFSQLKGVENVDPGYAGGKTENPTYEQVCTGTTGHVEVVQITFDPDGIS